MGALTFQHLREVNVARCVEGWKHPLDSWSPSDWMVALGGEVGEALNVIKKLNRERDGIIGNAKNSAELLADLADELADAVIYLDLYLARESMPLQNWVEASETSLDFGAVASDADGDVRERMPITMGELGADLLVAAGEMASVHPRDIRPGAVEFLNCAAMIANLAGIDLGAAVVSKFNRTSEKHGMPHRLVPA